MSKGWQHGPLNIAESEYFGPNQFLARRLFDHPELAAKKAAKAKKRHEARMAAHRCVKCDRKNKHMQTLGLVGLAIRDFTAGSND
jgi:ribosomal protein S14